MRDGHADDSLELPFPAELLLARTVVPRKNASLVGRFVAERLQDAWREKLSPAKRRVNSLARERVEEIGCVTNERRTG